MSQLTYAKAANVGGHEYIEESYTYAEDGNVSQFTKTTKDAADPVDATNTYGYTNGGVSDLMDAATGAEPFTLDTDENGNTTKLPTDTTVGNDVIEYNWDNKLRSAEKYVDASRTDSIAVKYDPMGNRVWKSSTVDGETTSRKFIVDISGGLPTLLCEIDTSDGSLKKSYVWIDDCRWTTDEVFKTVMPQAFHNFDFCSLIFDIAL